MDKILMTYCDELKKIYFDLYEHLKSNDLNSKKTMNFIFEIIKFYEISEKYFNRLEFDNNLKCKGVYLPEDRKIIFNISMLDAAYKLNFISLEQLAVDFYTLILHEINHLLQFRYKNLTFDNITKVLNISELLKCYLHKAKELHDLFPDEIDSNLRPSKVVYDIIGNDLSEQNLIYFLKLSMVYKNIIINSPLEYLHKYLLNEGFDKKFENINSIYYGLRKNQDLFNAMMDSYQTQKLCVDIDKERRLEKCRN